MFMEILTKTKAVRIDFKDSLVIYGLAIIRNSHPEVFYKKGVLKISQNLHQNTCPRVSFLIKMQAEV